MGTVHQTFMDNFKSYLPDTNLALFYYKLVPDFLHAGQQKEQLKKDFFEKILAKKYHKTKVQSRLAAIQEVADSVLSLKTTSRFICGTGYSSPIEWGFNFDWTTGAPLLPGSSFKGALLSYLEFIKQSPVEDDEKWKKNDSIKLLDSDTKWGKEEILEVFGPQGKEAEKHIGGVIFYDVYASDGNDKPFEVDVITPHYKKWYEGSRSVPDDTENPVPIPFLTVKPGVTFNFCYKIQPYPGAEFQRDAETLKRRIDELILECGRNYGFGAKTSSGYGYFEPA